MTGRRLRCSAPGLWDNLSRSTAGLGSSPTSIFAGPAPCKNFGVWPHPNCLPKRATRNMAQKNGGYAFFYVSSVSFDAFIAWIVASTIFNSLSSKAFNMASIRFLHSLPLFWTGKSIDHRYIKHCDHLIKGVEAWMLTIISLYIMVRGARSTI